MEIAMTPKAFKMILVAASATLLAMATLTRTPIAPVYATSAPAAQMPGPQSPNVAAGESEAKKLLLLMDKDQNGKVSRKEYMDFMAAEFDRLDVNKDGELDVKELTQSQLVQARGGYHR
jgi:hypothetical protein